MILSGPLYSSTHQLTPTVVFHQIREVCSCGTTELPWTLLTWGFCIILQLGNIISTGLGQSFSYINVHLNQLEILRAGCNSGDTAWAMTCYTSNKISSNANTVDPWTLLWVAKVWDTLEASVALNKAAAAYTRFPKVFR